MKIFADIKNKTLQFDQQQENGTNVLKFKNKDIAYSFLPLGQNRFSLIHDDKSHLIHIIYEGDFYHVHVEGEYFAVRVEDERSRTLRKLVNHASKAKGEQIISAPIPGLIRTIKVKEGDDVKKGDGIIVLEAMKMENEIRSESEGKISKIFVNEGTTVKKDQQLIIIK